MADSSSSILVVIHGMGIHTKESIKKTVEESGQALLNRYPSSKHLVFTDRVEVIPIGYDDIFERERERIVSANQTVSDYIKANSSIAGAYINKLISIEEAFGEDSFATTHLLDVVLYASLLCEEVRLRVAGELANAIKKSVAGDYKRPVHVLAHSLGTMVMHDTLAKLYSPDGGFDDGTDGEIGRFDPNQARLKSLWMIANVSNLMHIFNFLKTSLDPWDSVVKPARYDNSGCTQYFYNVHHKVDPFTLFKRFDPSLEDDWVAPRVYQRNYFPIETCKFTSSLNPHSLSNYLTNPNVGNSFISQVMPVGDFNVPDEEAEKAHREVPTIVNGAKAVRDRFANAENVEDFKGVILLIKDYLKFLEELRDA